MPYTVLAPLAARALGGIVGWRAAPDEMLQIQPRPRSRMPGRTSWARCSDALTWTSNITSIRRSWNSAVGTKYVTAALLTSTSTGPGWPRSRSRPGRPARPSGGRPREPAVVEHDRPVGRRGLEHRLPPVDPHRD